MPVLDTLEELRREVLPEVKSGWRIGVRALRVLPIIQNAREPSQASSCAKYSAWSGADSAQVTPTSEISASIAAIAAPTVRQEAKLTSGYHGQPTGDRQKRKQQQGHGLPSRRRPAADERNPEQDPVE